MRCKSIVIRVSVVVGLRCFAWNARASVSSNVVRWPCLKISSFSRLLSFKKSVQSRTSFPRAMRECQTLITWQAQHFERLHVALTSFFVRGATVSSCSCRFRGRRNTLELAVQISWQAQYFPTCVQISWQAQHFDGSSCSRCGMVRIWRSQSEPSADFGYRSRCGEVHILRSQTEPSARFGWVESLSLWRGSHFEIAK